jgi:hypothetical protein
MPTTKGNRMSATDKKALQTSEDNLKAAQETRYEGYRKYIEFNIRLILFVLVALLLMNVYRTYKTATVSYCIESAAP